MVLRTGRRWGEGESIGGGIELTSSSSGTRFLYFSAAPLASAPFIVLACSVFITSQAVSGSPLGVLRAAAFSSRMVVFRSFSAAFAFCSSV